MKKLFLMTIILVIKLINSESVEAQKPMKTITKNGMTVSWQHKNDQIFIEMEAPTDGWVTIGFNDNENTTGNYLLMGNVVNGKANVVEHHTLSAGNYKTFADLGVNNSVKTVQGIESKKNTKLQFSLPIASKNKYSRDLTDGKEYILLMAFSQEDDFQHHSMMRTSTKIIL